jgi:opacity protein-like surface antigen
MKKLIFALIAGVAAVGAAQAQTTNTAPRAYVGVGVATADSITVGGYKADAKIFGGYEFNQNVGIEAGYTNFGSTDFSRSANGQSVSGSTKGYGTYIAGKYNLPINEQFSAYGKLGLAYSERKYSNSLGMNYNDHDTGAYAGLGVQYNVKQNVALTAEYERYGKKKDSGAKANVWTVGVKYGF